MSYSAGNAGIVLAVLEYLKKKFPTKDSKQYPPKEILDERYSTWRIVINISVIPLMVIATVGVGYLLKLISQAWVPEFDGAQYILTADTLTFMLPGLFLGIISAGFLMFLITKLIFREHHDEYIYYNDLRDGGDGMRVFGLMSIIIVPPTLILAAFMIGSYSAVFDNHIIENPFAGFDEIELKHADAVKIEHRTWLDEDNNEQESFTVIYSNDYEWNPEGTFYEHDEERRNAILSLISAKSGVSITTKK